VEENGNVNEPVGSESNEPALEVRQPDGTRRPANATEARILRERGGVKANVPNPSDQAALDALRAKDDAEQAKQDAAREAGDESWKKLEDGEEADEPTELSVPGEVPKEHVERIEGYLTELAPMAQEARIPVSELQDIVDFAVSLGVSDTSRIDYAGNPDASIATLKRTYGEEGAAKIIADAQAAVRALPRSVADWLDSSGLGDDPSTLCALAAWKAGDLKMSPAKAQAELDKMKGEDLRSSAYKNVNHPQHKSAVARANLLYRVLEKADAKRESQPAPKRSALPSPANAKKASLERELQAAINDPDYRKSGPKHAAAVARVEALYREMFPGNRNEQGEDE
jgi:hypothetical protein